MKKQKRLPSPLFFVRAIFIFIALCFFTSTNPHAETLEELKQSLVSHSELNPLRQRFAQGVFKNPLTGDPELDGYGISLYRTYYIKDFYIDVIGNYGPARNTAYSITAQDVGKTRINETFLRKNDYGEISLSLGGRYHFNAGGLTVMPHSRINYLHANIAPYQEQLFNKNGYDGLDIDPGVIVEGQNLKSLTTVMGVEADHTFITTMGVLIPYLRVEWEHEFINNAQDIQVIFPNDYHAKHATDIIIISTDGPDKDYLNFGVGISSIFPHGVLAFIDYETVLALKEVTLHQISAGLRLEF